MPSSKKPTTPKRTVAPEFRRNYPGKRRMTPQKKKRLILSVIIILIIAVLTVVLVRTFSSKDNEKPTNAISNTVAGTSEEAEKTTPTETSTSTTAAPTTTTTKPTTTKVTTTARASSSSNVGSVASDGKVSFNMDSAYKSSYAYCVAVNRQLNVVTVYGKDANGEYTNPVKAMLCSCGIGGLEGGVLTPTGSYKSSRKDRWLLLIGPCWGQYTTKIYGSIFFHSVPYNTKSQSDLQYNEFVKLGQAASHGCIRLSTADAKWLYDNCNLGTLIYIYDSSVAGPLGKPQNVPFDVNSPNRGWDPTDPDAANPWNA